MWFARPRQPTQRGSRHGRHSCASRPQRKREQDMASRDVPGPESVMALGFLARADPHARVMSFGYDQENIGTFAEELLESLVSRRGGSVGSRPLVFICQPWWHRRKE